MLAELRQERAQIEEAIMALERLAHGQGKRRGRPPAWMTEGNVPKRRGRPPGSKRTSRGPKLRLSPLRSSSDNHPCPDGAYSRAIASKAVGVTGRSNYSPSTSASLSGALVVLVWREVAGQSRFRHDQAGDQDLGHTLSKSGAGSEDRRGSGQYVSPWMMTVWSSLSSRVMLDFPCSPLCGALGVPMPIGRLRSTSHCGEPRWIGRVPVRMSPRRDTACTLATRTPPDPAAARATTHPLPSPTRLV
jgi:hypothetical protein